MTTLGHTSLTDVTNDITQRLKIDREFETENYTHFTASWIAIGCSTLQHRAVFTKSEQFLATVAAQQQCSAVVNIILHNVCCMVHSAAVAAQL